MPQESVNQGRQPSSDPEETPMPAQPRQGEAKGSERDSPPASDEQIKTDQVLEDRFEATDN